MKIAPRLYECRQCGHQVTADTNHQLDFYPVCLGRCRHIINPHTAREVVTRKQTAHKFIRDIEPTTPTANPMSRPVIVEHAPDLRAYLVRYADRTPGQHHLAAQFDARDRTLKEVVEWVEANPKLHLLPPPPVNGEGLPPVPAPAPYHLSEDHRLYLDTQNGGGVIVQLRRKGEDALRYWGSVYVVPLSGGGYRDYRWLPLGGDTLIFRNAGHALQVMGERLDADFDMEGVTFLKATDFL